jgi:hypothetical protein
MHRFRTPELLLGALLTLAIFALGMLFHAQIASSATKDSDLTGWVWLTKDASGFFAMCAVFVAGLQAILFVVQLRYMGRTLQDTAKAAATAQTSAETAEKTFLLSARTWVFAGPQHIRELDEKLQFMMYAINYGRTPAIITELLIGFAAEEPSGPVNYDSCIRIQNSFPLGPDRDAFAFFDGQFVEPPEPDRLIIYGEVAYTDANNQPHFSRFCYRLASGERGWVALSAGGADWHRFD